MDKKALKITEIKENKKKYLDLLLLGDEQESMIDKYIEKGDMFVLLEEGETAAQCVVTYEGNGEYELKNIAVLPEKQGKGYGKGLIEFIFNRYSDLNTLYAGTGDSDLTLPFYKSCGFNEDYRVKNFFVDNYDHPIYENGKQLVDMVYLKKIRYKR